MPSWSCWVSTTASRCASPPPTRPTSHRTKRATGRTPRPSPTPSLPRAKPAPSRWRLPDSAAKPEDKAVDTGWLKMPPTTTHRPRFWRQGRAPRSPTGVVEFREERWVELYSKKIEEMITVMKSKGVPVWVGLPAIRGVKGTADVLCRFALYRRATAKAGITYVDVWDGFVDEAGRLLQKGPDFEGQIRQLRSYDGVFFTKPGARKLAHYVEREVTRLMAARSAPITLPTEPATPDANAVPGPASANAWQDRSCRWWHPRSAPTSCSADRDRAPPRSMRWPREPWSRASRSRRRPDAPMISSGRAVRSDANRPREKPRWLRSPRMERLRRRTRRRSRLKNFAPCNPATRRCGTCSEASAARHGSLRR